MLLNVLCVSLLSICISSSSQISETVSGSRSFLSRNQLIPGPTVYTPHGTPIYTYDRSSEILTQENIEDMNNEISAMCPNAVLLSNPSYLYNCHSYAWYLQNPQHNLLWIEDPSQYIVDYSYYEITSPSNVQVGDVIYYLNYYGEPIHSGRVSQLLGGTSNNVCGSANLFQVTSKFGNCGLYSHRGDECPYTSYNPSLSSGQIATSSHFYRILPNHVHSWNYMKHSNSKHLSYCACSYSFLEDHNWLQNNKSPSEKVDYKYNPSYVCSKCGKTSSFPY